MNRSSSARREADLPGAGNVGSRAQTRAAEWVRRRAAVRSADSCAAAEAEASAPFFRLFDGHPVERVDRERKVPADEAGGITNRPLDEEERNQDRLPDRGDARDGAHAGHGDGKSQKQEDR